MFDFFPQVTWNLEREKLTYEINRLTTVGAEIDVGRNDAEMEIIELQNELRDAEALLRQRDQEKEDLEKSVEERTAALNDACQGATRRLHEELETVKEALREKTLELQVRMALLE